MDGTADWVQSVRDADMDGDGLTDGEEQWLRTNILTGNSDGDDIGDLEETRFGGDIERNPRSFDGAPERPTIQVPTTPENPWIEPNLDTSPPGTVPQAALDVPADDLALASDDTDFAAGEPDVPDASFDDATGDELLA
jgi:hypothetical protein